MSLHNHHLQDFVSRSFILITQIFIILSLRDQLRTHGTLIEDKIICGFLHDYHKFSIKSYVVAIY